MNTTTMTTPQILSLDYQYEQLLGEGANGRTWLARDRKTGFRVAIKELKLSSDPKALELFEREAEVLQSVNIKGVPKFYNSIISPILGETSYIVQEYILHNSLQSALDSGQTFDEPTVIKLIDAVAAILQALQTQYVPPIIHRDIKPANILYNINSDGTVEVWLIDFGAVANPQKQSGGSTIAGTFGYMAPEQLQGAAAIQSDFYALGATALHLLTGVSPYNIECETFKLKYEPILEQKVPNASSIIKDFLAATLAPNANDRPSTAIEIRKLLSGQNKDNEVQIIDRQTSSIIEFLKSKFLRLFSSKDLATTPSKWVTNDGIIHTITGICFQKSGALEYRPCFEATYMYKGNCFHAFADFNNPMFRYKSEEDLPQNIPSTSLNAIQVACNPKRPEEYRFDSQVVWLSKDLYKQYENIQPKSTLSTLCDHCKNCLKENNIHITAPDQSTQISNGIEIDWPHTKHEIEATLLHISLFIYKYPQALPPSNTLDAAKETLLKRHVSYLHNTLKTIITKLHNANEFSEKGNVILKTSNIDNELLECQNLLQIIHSFNIPSICYFTEPTVCNTTLNDNDFSKLTKYLTSLAPKRIAVTGPIHVGKSSFLINLFNKLQKTEQVPPASGFVETAVFSNNVQIGYDFVQPTKVNQPTPSNSHTASNKTRHTVARKNAPGEPYTFYDDAWKWAKKTLKSTETDDILFIDELGKLESRNEGLMPLLTASLKRKPRHIIASVRLNALDRIAELLGGDFDMIITLSDSDYSIEEKKSQNSQKQT